jgi:GntR family transcriptional repressor for pyruvate dehydrogenase complex
MMFRALRRVRASDQVADEVTDRILDGALRPGDKLPGERDLADQFNVNRSTVREAIKSLSDLGLVVARQGGGTVVQDYMLRAGLKILPTLFLRGDDSGELLRSVLESRRIFAIEVTKLAAMRAKKKDLTAMRKLVAEMDGVRDDPTAFQALDFDFVQLLARASENWVFRLITNSVRPIYDQRPELFLALVQDTGPIVAGYRAVIDAVAARDGDRAARAIEKVMLAGEAKLKGSK